MGPRTSLPYECLHWLGAFCRWAWALSATVSISTPTWSCSKRMHKYQRNTWPLAAIVKARKFVSKTLSPRWGSALEWRVRAGSSNLVRSTSFRENAKRKIENFFLQTFYFQQFSKLQKFWGLPVNLTFDSVTEKFCVETWSHLMTKCDQQVLASNPTSTSNFF